MRHVCARWRHLRRRERHVRSLSEGKTFSQPQFLFCKISFKVPQLLHMTKQLQKPRFKSFQECLKYFVIDIQILSSAAKGGDVQREHNPVRECDGGSLPASALQGETFLSPNEIQRNQKSNQTSVNYAHSVINHQWSGGSERVMGEWLLGQWIVGVISFQKIYGLYGLKHHRVEISGDVTDAGRTDEQTNDK